MKAATKTHATGHELEPRGAAGFGLGDLVEMVPRCPLESEGVGPLPGDIGEIVGAPSPGDDRQCWQVRFIRVGASWLIPQHFLRRATMH